MQRALNHLRQADARLGGLIDRVGAFRMNYRPPDLSTLVRSIVFQQLSGKAAATIYGRVEAAMGKAGVRPGPLLAWDDARFRSLGLSSQKTGYLRDLAARTRSGELDFAALADLDDQAVIERLTQVKGVGVWTAQMFLIFALRRRDVLPVGDLGIRNAIERLYELPAPPKPAGIEALGARWRPWCSVASWYLWRSLDNGGEI
jgi:DNA-3-methyladenine glycosylase II